MAYSNECPTCGLGWEREGDFRKGYILVDKDMDEKTALLKCKRCGETEFEHGW
jgi:ribosomal protein S27AE